MVFAAVTASLDDLRAWPASLPWALREPSVGESESFCRQAQANFLIRKDFPLLALRKVDGAMVCSTGLHRLDWSIPKAEVGYWGNRTFRGQGYVAEAVQGVLAFAWQFLELRRIEALPDMGNAASRSVAERAGLMLEGILRHERKEPDGTLRDTCVYAAVR